MQYSLDEVTIIPCAFPTDINSRKEVNPFDKNGNLPIFVAPMTSVINDKNYFVFKQHKVIPILPRGYNVFENQDKWTSVSLSEFEKLVDDGVDLNYLNILIDIANGHIKKIYDLVKRAKDKSPLLTVMVGNIAHPYIYRDCCASGVDYVRVGIGGGSACTTSVQSGIHASHQWILSEMKNLYCYNKDVRTKIIADGGINTIDKAIKCLALGADYVMMGKCFAQCKEACGEVIDGKRKYYGMASTQGQIDISGGANKNPEGIETLIPINSSLDEFTFKFESALRSAMSYTGHATLKDFTKHTRCEIMSISEFNNFYK